MTRPAKTEPDKGLSLTNVCISTEAGEALFQPISLQVAPGEVVVLTGPSGIGKSSLLDLILGMLSPNLRGNGSIRLNGRDLAGTLPEQRRIGVMFQDALLFPHLNVAQNLGFALKRGGSAQDRRATIAKALENVGLAGMERRDPASLSGGEAQRVALMRSLLAEPEALLLDEPFSRLDPARRRDLLALVLHHVAEAKIPALMVSHDVEDLVGLGNLQVVKLVR